jgi:hypothetical protein
MPIVNTRDQFLSLSQRMQLVTAKAKCNKLRKKYRKNPPQPEHHPFRQDQRCHHPSRRDHLSVVMHKQLTDALTMVIAPNGL